MKLSKNINNLGQTLLIVLLVMAVSLVVVLSIISRTVTDVGVTTREEEATRAFSAAEAGIERALLVGSIDSESFPLGNNSSYTITVKSVGEGVSEYNFPFEPENAETTTLWFVSHNGDDLVCGVIEDGGEDFSCYIGDNMEVFWGDPEYDYTDDPAVMPAVELTLYYDSSFRESDFEDQDFSGVDVKRLAYDYNDTRNDTNKFANAYLTSGDGDLVDGEAYEFKTGILRFSALTSFNIGSDCDDVGDGGCLLMLKIRMLYNTDPNANHGIGVKVYGDTLPAQANKVESLGVAGESSRKIEVYQSYPELPPIFESALFNPTEIVKN